ncbi:MAG: thioredoxin family protein [Ferruginibacter sp.]|nr:thioredoxin family protein [Chitinophagaceae bacterium]
MNKKLFITGVLIIIAVVVFAFFPKSNTNLLPVESNFNGDKGIQFVEPNWAKAIEQAKKEKKMIFVDAYTTWCGPCRMLKQNTFPDKAAGEFFNKHFINIALDMEKGDGLAFAEKYQIRAYPTLLIMDADLKSTSIAEGYMNPAQLIEFGKYVINKLPKVK